MKLLGFEITLAKAAPASASPVPYGDRGWYPLVRESFTGAWQRNITVDRQTVLSYHATWACITLIASDIAKLACRLVEKTGMIWVEAESSAFSPVLRKPNRYQTRIQFWENWIISKLTRGNAYVLKERDSRGVVVALYVLDPSRVKPLVTDDGEVYYELNTDNLAGVAQQIAVPASEIIHDRFNCLFHPLVGSRRSSPPASPPRRASPSRTARPRSSPTAASPAASSSRPARSTPKTPRA
jgi:phage portal protein BeeE